MPEKRSSSGMVSFSLKPDMLVSEGFKAIVNNNECSVDFTGYVIVKREF